MADVISSFRLAPRGQAAAAAAGAALSKVTLRISSCVLVCAPFCRVPLLETHNLSSSSRALQTDTVM